ncbi:MAG: transglutaminase-like domain-containing protein [Planctomycetota bacterium]|nr:transglutaminase-like domain-containing protein [Planctomycetota bacterium]
MKNLLALVLGICVSAGTCLAAPPALEQALQTAGTNRPQIQQALDQVPSAQRKGLIFLVENMPAPDLETLQADYLLKNVNQAYRAWEGVAWKKEVPEEVFLNDVLPYSVINERRDDWRKDFYDRFHPLVKDATSPGEAAVILNKNVFKIVNVKYSTGRKKPDQSPYESMETGLASCSGLTVILVDACRSVGVPARFVGTPLWTNKSGNHSWAEVWDQGWHFTGACEPAGDDLDRAWFVGRAATADRNHLLHSIYAVSYKKTPQFFPMVWSQEDRSISAVNVSDYYTRLGKKLPEGVVLAYFKVVERKSGARVAADLVISTSEGKQVFEGQSNDERFDANNHVQVQVKVGDLLTVRYITGEVSQTRTVKVKKPEQVFSFAVEK